MAKFIYFTPEEKARAQNTDLVSLLRAQGERPIRSGREYRTPNDPSVTIRGNKWFDHSKRALSNAKYGCGFRDKPDDGRHRLHGSRTPLRFSQNAPLPCGGSRPVRTASRSDCGWMSAALALACRNATIFRNIP